MTLEDEVNTYIETDALGSDGMEITELTKRALKQWGSQSQLDMVIEECAELIDAIQKWRRRRVDSTKVLEEGVDVELGIAQLKLMLDAPVLWENAKKDKLDRLKKLLDRKSMDKPNCYKCRHRHSILGDAHSSCQHPKYGLKLSKYTEVVGGLR